MAATAADPQSGVTHVLFEYKPAAAADWLPIGAGALTVNPGEYGRSWDTPLAGGAYDLRAIAKNGARATTPSAVVSVTVDNTPPAMTPPCCSSRTILRSGRWVSLM